MIDLESTYGVPTVAVHVDVFDRLVRSVAKVNGMPNAWQAFIPTPIFNQPPAVLRGYVEGNDPTHSRPFMEQVFDLLTRPLADGDRRGEGFDRSRPRLLEPDTEENLLRLFRENRWTDFLPMKMLNAPFVEPPTTTALPGVTSERFWADLRDRLAEFSLELNAEKTRLIEFGRLAALDRLA